MKKKALLIISGVVLTGVIFIILFPPAPDLSRYDSLKEPQMRVQEKQKVVVVEAKGNPDTVGSSAFKLLFKTYFSIKGAPKGPKMPAPRARWPLSAEIPEDQWIGMYALPVPQETAVLPAVKTDPGITVRLDTWEYGEVAEILHIGPYDREKPTIDRLTAFIRESGYTIIGDHEEEYLKGPGMFFRGNPEKYYTIIRYRVQKTQ